MFSNFQWFLSQHRLIWSWRYQKITKLGSHRKWFLSITRAFNLILKKSTYYKTIAFRIQMVSLYYQSSAWLSTTSCYIVIVQKHFSFFLPSYWLSSTVSLNFPLLPTAFPLKSYWPASTCFSLPPPLLFLTVCFQMCAFKCMLSSYRPASKCIFLPYLFVHQSPKRKRDNQFFAWETSSALSFFPASFSKWRIHSPVLLVLPVSLIR